MRKGEEIRVSQQIEEKKATWNWTNSLFSTDAEYRIFRARVVKKYILYSPNSFG